MPVAQTLWLGSGSLGLPPFPAAATSCMAQTAESRAARIDVAVLAREKYWLVIRVLPPQGARAYREDATDSTSTLMKAPPRTWSAVASCTSCSDRVSAIALAMWESAPGLYCEFQPKRSSHREGAHRRVRTLRPPNFVQLTFALCAVAPPVYPTSVSCR